MLPAKDTARKMASLIRAGKGYAEPEVLEVIEADRRAARLEVLAELERRHDVAWADGLVRPFQTAIDALRSELEKATPSGAASKT